MTATFETLDHTTSVQVADGLIARIATALARAKARREYRQMLALEDHLLTDIGVKRSDVRRALIECGGRP